MPYVRLAFSGIFGVVYLILAFVIYRQSLKAVYAFMIVFFVGTVINTSLIALMGSEFFNIGLSVVFSLIVLIFVNNYRVQLQNPIATVEEPESFSYRKVGRFLIMVVLAFVFAVVFVLLLTL